MNQINLINELEDRGLISYITNKKKLKNIIQSSSISLYCGFDPTADSLHVGHLLPLITLKRFQIAGHKPVILIGGATSLIGDPSFKNKERNLQNTNNINLWIKKIKKQFSLFLDFYSKTNNAIILNNNTWFNEINLLVFLREIGKHFSVSTMINRESVKNRIKRPDQGISFTEFSYSLLQAYDFFILNKTHQVSLQIGGSDQWGNISSGMHLVSRLSKSEVYGLTIPLLTQSNGIKFGKTEDGTIWLDPKKTSPYKFYQFWINIEDIYVYKFLKFFTFIELSEIRSKKNDCSFDKNILNDKILLARNITYLVHGEKQLRAAERITEFLFLKNIKNLKKSDFQQLKQDGVPFIHACKIKDLQDALVLCSLSQSRTQSKNMILSHSISINTYKNFNKNYMFCDKDKLFNEFTLLSRGKKNHCLICWKK